MLCWYNLFYFKLQIQKKKKKKRKLQASAKGKVNMRFKINLQNGSQMCETWSWEICCKGIIPEVKEMFYVLTVLYKFFKSQTRAEEV